MEVTTVDFLSKINRKLSKESLDSCINNLNLKMNKAVVSIQKIAVLGFLFRRRELGISLKGFTVSVLYTRFLPERSVLFPVGGKLVSYPKRAILSCVKTSETAATTKYNDKTSEGAMDKSVSWRPTFPSGFEALILDVCDETEIAELKLKIGDFEMNLKRNIGTVHSSTPVLSPTTPPPIPSKPMIESVPAAAAATQSTPPKSTSEKNNPFANAVTVKSFKLESLEASGATGFVIVSSTTVDSFWKGRTFKGKKQPLICKEGDVIKEGQVIGFLDQFGTELPVKSNVAGEVLKLLVNDGEAVGYGDPLMAVLPSFHDIKL